MPKYRLLTTDELQQFEKEFIDYLIVNGIDADTWANLKIEKQGEAKKIIELFSDVVFEKILRKAKYLVFTNGPYLYSFRYGERKANLYILKFQDVQFASDSSSQEEILEFIRTNQDNCDLQLQEKNYTNTREQEVFAMLESGCIIEEGGIFQFCVKLNKNSDPE